MALNSLKCILNTTFETNKKGGNFHTFWEIFTLFWKFSHFFGNFHTFLEIFNLFGNCHTFLEPFPNVIVSHQYNKEAYIVYHLCSQAIKSRKSVTP